MHCLFGEKVEFESNSLKFRQITTVIKVRVAFVFGLQTLFSKDFSKIYQLKGLKLKNIGRTNFYECCDLMKKLYLILGIKTD